MVPGSDRHRLPEPTAPPPQPFHGPMCRSRPSRTVAAMSFLRFLRRLALTSLLVVALSGAGHLILSPAAATSGSAAQAVVALTEGTATADDIPASFEEIMGYRPVAAGGVLVKPTGGCSTPPGLDHAAFRDPCRAHDLGYDLLRYAESTHEPLGPWARLAIDRRFHRDLDGTCGSVGCRLLARAYGFGVALNSVRQGFTVPVPEPGGPWLAVVGAMIVVALLPRPRRLGHPPLSREITS